jgi:hypothetical protein
VLRLEVLDYAGPTRWRWRLTDARGGLLAEHDVDLDEREWQTTAFADLHGYVRANVDPDRRLAHEAELVAGVGAWLSERVMGQVALELAKEGGPVRLEVPPEAAELAYRPWELAMVDEQPLVARRVSFVVDARPGIVAEKAPVGERLRMLAVFGVPDGTDELHPRGERFALARAVHGIASAHRKAIELRVVQYGMTRDRLREVIRDPEGWDVVQVSGPGLAAGLVLTDDAGRPDVVSGKELVDLLEPAGRRVRLVVLIEGESAGVTVAEVGRTLGLSVAAPVAGAGSLPAVADEVARRLDSAVVAVRHPVSDEFAVQLAEQLYTIVLGIGHTVADGVPPALIRVAGGSPTTAVPPLSVGALAVFGGRAVEPLAVPSGYPVVFQTERERLAEFPPQPVRFAGRAALLARAAAALAEQSGHSGVVLHGVPGVGATTCAVELAYTHQDSFAALAWYSVPRDGDVADPGAALADCALAMERQIPGLRLAHLVHDPATWRAALPELTEGLARWRVLVVLDNVDTLLTETGQWRDERWELFAHALTAHDGPARAVITAHRPPAGLPAAVAVECVPALSLAETVLLTWQWTSLRELVAAANDETRALITGVLAAAQGHPALLELAQGDAADPGVLAERVADADRTWRDRGVLSHAFLSGAEPAGDHLPVLSGWVDAILAALPDDAALLLEFLCCLRQADRIVPVVTSTWPVIWRSRYESDVPDLDPTAVVLVRHGLVEVDIASDSGQLESYWIQPAVADRGRRRVPAGFADAVATTVGDSWLATQRHAAGRPAAEEMGWLVTRSARSAAPYLTRLRRWADLAVAATLALSEEDSATAAALLPMLTAGVAATRGGGDELAMAQAHAATLSIVDPDAAEPALRLLRNTAVTEEDLATATAVATDPNTLYPAAGRSEDAVAMTEMVTEFDTGSGSGPWADLAAECARLQALFEQGRLEEVLAAVDECRARMATVADGQDGEADAGTIRESILGVGVFAAHDLGQWATALELNAAILQSQEDRRAGEAERAVTCFNDYGPLLRLGRGLEARDLLYKCRAAFARAEDITMMGNTLSALADADSHLGHRDLAVEQEADALRLKYRGRDPEAIAVSHYNLANYLIKAGQSMRAVWAHRLAGAVIRYQIGSPRLATSLQSVGKLVGRDEATVRAPLSFNDLCLMLDGLPEVRFAELFALLPDRAGSGQAALDDVMRLTGELRDAVLQESVAAWEPIISAMVAAARPDADDELNDLLEEALSELGRQHAWKELVTVLRRIYAGPEHHSEHTIDNIDPASTVIARRARAALAGEVTVDPAAWRTLIEQT